MAAAVIAIGIGVALLLTTGVLGSSAPQVTAVPTAAPTRRIVSSTISGSTPTATSSPLAVTPVPAVGGSLPSAAPGLTLSPGPPAQVQPVTPVTPARASAPPALASAGGLPGALATARPATPVPTTSIEDELRSIDATATALSSRIDSLASSPTASSGTPRAAATETPIPTAAPPVVPQPSI